VVILREEAFEAANEPFPTTILSLMFALVLPPFTEFTIENALCRQLHSIELQASELQGSDSRAKRCKIDISRGRCSQPFNTTKHTRQNTCGFENILPTYLDSFPIQRRHVLY